MLPTRSTTNPPEERLACGALWFLVPAAATINLGSLIVVLYAGRIHPVRYYLDLVPARELSSVVFATSAAAAAMFLVLLRWTAARYWKHAPTGRRAVYGACLPAAAAPAWSVFLVGSPPAGLIILFSCICLFAWTSARLVGVFTECDQESGTSGDVPLESPTHHPAWWREAWFIVLFLAVAALTVFHTSVQIGMYDALCYGSPDIGYYAEMLHNATRGRGLRCEAYGHDFFGEHFSPGLYLLVPLWAMFGRIELLMVLGSASVLSGCLPVYALARISSASSRVAALLSFSYLLYPSASRIIYGGTYGFHEILLAIPLMLWAFYHYRRGRLWWMAVFMILALSLKENVAVVWGAFGIYVYVRDRRDRWGLALCIGCIAYFAICLMWIVPGFSTGDEYSKYYLYSDIGGTPGGILANLFRHPGTVLGRLVSWQALCYVLSLSVPVAMVLFRHPAVIVALPTIIFTLLMNTPDFSSIRFWHQASIIPVIWWAVVDSVTRKRRSPSWPTAVFVSALTMHYCLGFSPVSQVWRGLPETIRAADRSELIDKLQRMIPPESTVQASARLAAHFYDRDRIFPMHVDPPAPPDWIVIDINESFTGPENRETTLEFLKERMALGSYELAFRESSVHVLRLRRQTSR